MKRPNLFTASIGDILTWCANHNGKVRSAKQQAFIEQVLSRASFLDRVKEMRWSANKWVDKAWNDIQAIGVTETLELREPKARKPQAQWGSFKVGKAQEAYKPLCTTAQLRECCEALGLYFHRFDGRAIITRKPLTISGNVTMVADMPPSERGNSSPELGMDVDPNAKLYA